MNATILGQAIAFILFVWFCMKFVWPPIIGAIEKRQKEIAEGLAVAESVKKELALAKANTSELIQEAKAEASSIIEHANKRKAEILEEAKHQAMQEKEKIIAKGMIELSFASKRAREELRKHVASLAIAGAEKIIKRSIDKDVNSDIIDNLMTKL